MTRIADVDPEDAPTVLIVDNNQMSLMRLSEIFRQRDFAVVQCEDGDKAVDEYIRLDPELAVISLDIPTLDGHVAALEMREHGGDCRILFTAPRRLRQVAEDATHSAGAVSWVEKPVTSTSIDEVWGDVLGEIPEAPGLADLDQLHPGDEIPEVQIDEDIPPPPTLPALIMPTPKVSMQVTSRRSKRRKTRWKLRITLWVIILGLGYAASVWKNLFPNPLA